MPTPPNAGNPVRLISPFHRIVGVNWGTGPFALIEMDGAGASLDVLDAKTPTPPHFTFPVAGQPSDTINPNTYKKSATPVLAGFDTTPGDLIHDVQPAWFVYGSDPPGAPAAPTPNDGTRTYNVTISGNNFTEHEFEDVDFVPEARIPTDRSKDKYYYLVDLGVINKLRIINGVIAPTTFTYDTVLDVSGYQTTFNAVFSVVEQPGWVFIGGGQPGTTGTWSPFVGSPISRFQPTLFGLPSQANAIETNKIDVAGVDTITKVSVYAGGIFEKDGQTVTWHQWPLNPNPNAPIDDPTYTGGGRLLWSTTITGTTPVTIDKTGVIS